VIQGLTVGLGANAVANNTAVGVNALASGTLSGASNVAVGTASLTANTTGNNNTAVGYAALYTNQTGIYNSAVGQAALFASTGNFNTAVGMSALTASTGAVNLALGQNAGSALTTGSNNTIIGSVAGTAGLSDTVIIAAGSAERMRIDSSGNVGIGTASPSGKLQVQQTTDGTLLRLQRTGGSNIPILNVNLTESTNLIEFEATGATGASIVFKVGGTERMRIDGSGVISYTGSLTVSAYTETIVASGTVGASATLAITAGTVLTATLTSATACTFTMPTATAGKSFILLLKQPASGTATTATFTGVKFNASGAPTITATVGAMDILTFVADGTNWYGSYSQGYTP
jgi:hypothetical protein